MASIIAGLDIGGTKCAVSLGKVGGDGITILRREAFSTPKGPDAAIDAMLSLLSELLEQESVYPASIGISCGGPLNSRLGLIQQPPNLPGWIDVPIVEMVRKIYPVPVLLQNDANACAVAEWKLGAGRGLDSLVFLTFGTGMGAGLILDGRLYSGQNDLAGEVGHMRLADAGPVGFGKAGSFEGFCSGGGIARLAALRLDEMAKNGPLPAAWEGRAEQLTTKDLGEAAQRGDPFAISIFTEVAQRLGQGIALMIDMLNPQAVILGSIYVRQQRLLEPILLEVLERECLPHSYANCRILPAALGESVGDYAALCLATLEQR